MFSEVHIEIGVGLEVVKVLPPYLDVKVTSFDGFDDQIDPLCAFWSDDSVQRFNLDVALFEVWLLDVEGAFMVAAIDEL